MNDGGMMSTDGGSGSDSGQDGSTGAVEVSLSGAVQKGPFVLGSSVAVSPVNGLGNASGTVYNTATIDNLGRFAVEFAYQGGVSIEGNGYYYNEVTGDLSQANLTLRAFYNVTQQGEQSAYVNILTHLAYGRVKQLLQETGNAGASTIPASVIAQAEAELMEALTIGGPGFDPQASYLEMNIVGGDSDADAYAFAVSTILTEVARRNAAGGSLEAALQELLNTTSQAFAEDGTIGNELVSTIQTVQQELDPVHVMTLLRKRLAQIGSNATVPNLHRVWDGDGDGVPDLTDPCALLPNVSGAQAANNVCRAVRRVVSDTTLFAAAGDFTNDGNADVVVGSGSNLHVLPGDGAGNFGAPISTNLNAGIGIGRTTFGTITKVLDVNGDSNLDLVGNIGAEGAMVVHLGNGQGTFGNANEVLRSDTITNQGRPVCFFEDFLARDVNGDGHLDFIGRTAQHVYVVFKNGASSQWGDAYQVDLGGAQWLTGMGLFDYDGDDRLDLVLATGNAGLLGAQTTGTSEPYFDVLAPVTFNGSSNVGGLAIGDVVGDARPDVVVATQRGFAIFPGTSSGVGTVVVIDDLFQAGSQPLVSLLIGQLNGSGKHDVLGFGGGAVQTFISNGSTLVASATIPFSPYVMGSPADFDNNGTMDFAVKYGLSDREGSEASVFLINP